MKLAKTMIASILVVTASGQADEHLKEQRLIDNTQPAIKGDVILPNASTRIVKEADAYVTADFILWEAQQGNLDFAQTGEASSSAGQSSLSEGSTYHPTYQYNPGFRAGLGIGMDHDGWGLYVDYTWYHQNSNATRVNHTPGATGIMTPTANFALAPTSLNYASGDWTLRMNYLDLELSRNSYVSRSLAIKTFAGLKASWQNQNFDVIYRSTPSRSITQQYNLKQHMKAFGIGFRAGMNSEWQITPSWSIFANFAGSLLSSRFKANDKITTFNVDTPANSQLIAINENKTSAIQPVVEMAMGFGYNFWFGDGDYHLGIKAGWEEQFWFRNNYMLRAYDGEAGGNLSMQGLTLKVRFDF